MIVPNLKALSDRHARPATELLPIERARTGIVRLGCDLTWANSTAGQHLLWMSVNLLARQTRVVRAIRLDVPNVPLHDGVAAFGARSSLRDTLAAVVDLVAGPHVSVSFDDVGDYGVDIDLWVGRYPPNMKQAELAFVMIGDGWNAFAGVAANAPTVTPKSDNPIGPYFAACLGTGEVFKRLRGLRKGVFIERLVFSLWDGEIYDRWDELPDASPIAGLTVPHFYLVGAGAVGQTLALVLGAARSLRGYATIIDHQVLDDTNLNRYLVARLRDLNRPKVKIAAKLLRQRGFSVYAYQGTLKNYLSDLARPRQHDDVRLLEAALRYEIVLSCVDNNIVRHEIQNIYPRQLFGASTSGLRAMVVDYDMQAQFQCLKCWNPLPPWHDSLRALSRDLHEMRPAERAAWAQEHGLDAEAIERHLANPKCGEIGEQELSRFTIAEEPMFSVGFVSAAAGILLTARLLRSAIDGHSICPDHNGPSLAFSFASTRALWFSEPRASSCTCDDIGGRRYARQWSGPMPA